VATRKDQLDAFNFARRRTVANLVVPSATGSDEGAPRPVRTFASSIILSAIAVAAVAVLGVFKPSAPSGWQNGLAVDSSSGAAYIVQGNELHSVYNITSARLILGSKFAKFDVPDSTLNNSGMPIGSPIGILGAPADVPAPSNMNLTQWSLCQNEAQPGDESVAGGQTYLEIGYGPTSSTTRQGPWTSSSDVALVVHDDAGEVYLVDQDHRYLVGNDKSQSEQVLQLLNAVAGNSDSFNSADETGYWVSDAWLDVFPLGTALSSPELADFNAPAQGEDPLGSVGQFGPVAGGGGVVQADTGVVELGPVAYDLYIADAKLTDDKVARLPQNKLTPSAINAAILGSPARGTVDPSTAFESDTYGTDWPKQNPVGLWGADTSDADAQNICLGYQYTDAANVGDLSVWLSSQLPYGTAGAKFGLNQTTSQSLANTILVKPGSGVIAQGSEGGAAQGDEYLIEDSGYRYALLSDQATANDTSPQTAVEMLGYQNATVQPVLSSLLSLIPVGASLQPSAAGTTPSIENIG
jgi:type VII secretion protein EccB